MADPGADLPPLAWTLEGAGDPVDVAFSSVADGDQRDPERRRAFACRVLGSGAPSSGPGRPVVVPRQVHGAVVVTVDPDRDQGPELALADGVASHRDDHRPVLGAYGADCPGVVVVAPDALGVAHCGWRGTAAGMAGILVARVAVESRFPPSAFVALIGPGISGPRYEVDAPVLEARTWPSEALAPGRDPHHVHLDLATVLALDLQAAGIPRIVASRVCTAGDPRLRSHRHGGPGPALVLLAWRRH